MELSRAWREEVIQPASGCRCQCGWVTKRSFAGAFFNAHIGRPAGGEVHDGIGGLFDPGQKTREPFGRLVGWFPITDEAATKKDEDRHNDRTS